MLLQGKYNNIKRQKIAPTANIKNLPDVPQSVDEGKQEKIFVYFMKKKCDIESVIVEGGNMQDQKGLPLVTCRNRHVEMYRVE